jgi:hypothetical protein
VKQGKCFQLPSSPALSCLIRSPCVRGIIFYTSPTSPDDAIVKNIPEWVPGTSYHAFARKSRELTREMRFAPLKQVKEQMASALQGLPSAGVLIICAGGWHCPPIVYVVYAEFW